MKTAVIYDKWLSGLGGGEVVACNVARILKDNGYDVLFLSKDKVPVEKIKSTLGIDLSDVTFKQVANERDLLLTTNDYRLLTSDYRPPTIDLFINISFMDYSYGIAKKNIYYTHFPTPMRGFLFNLILTFFQTTGIYTLFPSRYYQLVRDRIRAGIFFDMKRRLASYDLVLSNSKYTQKWIKRYWERDAQVLYPPVNFLTTNHQPLATSTKGRLPSGQKQNWIVSVGRFFTLGHGKKQEILIEAFKKLSDSQANDQRPATNDFELHLIGGVGKEPSSIRYVEQLKEMAKGYPIFFHFNIKQEEVEKILMQSKIYWHATGYGVDKEKYPIRFEHFGIAPVEAISAGCIPILFNGGGLPEIIEKLHLPMKNHLFTTAEELIQKTTVCLAETPIKTTDTFSRTTFEKNLLGILK